MNASVFRYTRLAIQEWGAANGIQIAFKNIRDPLLLTADEDEQVMMRIASARGSESRGSQRRGAMVVEFHCLSHRGDLREDGQADRAEVLASMVEREFLHKDIDIFDVTGTEGGASVRIGSLQFLSSTWRNGDQRGTIYADGVDYSLETPKTEHWVVTMIATLNS
jgi:hypothetical protein